MRLTAIMAVLLATALSSFRVAAGAEMFFSPAPDKAVRCEAYVDGPVGRVWSTLTSGAGWQAFLGAPAEIDLRPGGRFEVDFDPSAPEGMRGSEGCRVLSYLPQRMVSFSWNAPPQFEAVRGGEYKTVVVVETLEAGASRTLVRLTHHGWPSDAEASAAPGGAEQWGQVHDYFQQAWPGVLQKLASYFAPEGGGEASAKRDPKSGWLYTFVGLKRPDLLETLTEEERKQFSAHARYIKRLCEEGTVVFAGPCTDMKGPAVVVLDARSEAEARALMQADPAVKHGLMRADLHPVRLAFVRWRDAR